jgi:ribose-phosphate pyrophosphokinase
LTPKLVGGASNPGLWNSISRDLGVELCQTALGTFPDGELEVEVEGSVRGADVYLLQSTCPPVDSHLMQLLLLADACHRAGAARLTAIIPYFGYARQDRRSRGRQPIAARLATELIRAASVERVVSVDLHSPAIEGFSPAPLEHVSAAPLLCDALKGSIDKNMVVVAPDVGAVKLAERYASALGLSVALVEKTRVSGTEVRATAVVGEVSGKRPLIVDDMISTGGTVAAAYRALLGAGAVAPVTVAATHGLFVGRVEQVLGEIDTDRILVSDTVPGGSETGLPVERVGTGSLLAEVIRRLHEERSMADLIKHD